MNKTSVFETGEIMCGRKEREEYSGKCTDDIVEIRFDSFDIRNKGSEKFHDLFSLVLFKSRDLFMIAFQLNYRVIDIGNRENKSVKYIFFHREACFACKLQSVVVRNNHASLIK
jgi:hypothetical protein